MKSSARESSSDLLFPKDIPLEQLRTMPVAMLVSGGVESASLVCVLAQYFASVQPVYVRLGLAWERIEYQYLLKYLDAVKQARINSLKVFDMPVDNIYGKHWSTTGYDVPDADTDDKAVYLPGRNFLLLTQTAVWCALNKVHFIALGSLGTNPFPDASDKFFDQLQNTLTTGLNFDINILRPYSNMHKHQVILQSKDLPLHLTFSCINPVITPESTELPIHCGLCNKCAERQKAFIEAQAEDRTIYCKESN